MQLAADDLSKSTLLIKLRVSHHKKPVRGRCEKILMAEGRVVAAALSPNAEVICGWPNHRRPRAGKQNSIVYGALSIILVIL